MKYILHFSIVLLCSCSNHDDGPRKVSYNGYEAYVMPGINGGKIKQQFLKQGFANSLSSDGKSINWDYSYEDEDQQYLLNVAGISPLEIYSIRGYAQFNKSIDVIEPFFEQVAFIDYPTSNHDAAMKWVKRNYNKGGDTTIGDVKFKITGVKNTRMIDLFYKVPL